YFWGYAITCLVGGTAAEFWGPRKLVFHPRITDEEKQYILEAIGDKVQQSSKENKIVPPFKKIFTSFPFLAMVVLHYGSNWGLYFMMTAAPKFVSSALGFDLTSTGTLASLPKFFCLFSHVVPGLLLIALGYTGCAPILSIALISFSMGSNGAATLTNLVNHQDLAPNYAATLYGIANGIGNTAGFVTPLVTAYFTKNGVTSAGYFILFGTAEIQSWNYVPVVEDEEDKRPPVVPTSSTPTSSTNSTETTVSIPIKT
ncbi:Sodium-dependent phosphate transporter, partial [Operophtera brumata]